MHELSIVTNVLDTAVAVAKKQDALKLTAVNLKIGEFKQVEDDALMFSWDFLSNEDSFSKGAKLNVEYVLPASICPECGCEFDHDMFHRKCPECGCEWTTPIRGSELEISSIEVEKP